MSDEEDAVFDKDKNQDEIRAELSQMSFEDLQKLKEKLGMKVYKESLFGKKKVKNVDFKRQNKNRPREMSAKKPVPLRREVIPVKKPIIPRDPRFDSLCGTFDPKQFKSAYGFLTKIKENDLNELEKQLQNTRDPEMIKKIKFLMQRLSNQIREEKKMDKQKSTKHTEKKEIVEAIKQGNKPIYRKKSEKRVLDLVAQYEDLKTSGRLKKHIQRLRKKNLQKARQKMEQSHVV